MADISQKKQRSHERFNVHDSFMYSLCRVVDYTADVTLVQFD